MHSARKLWSIVSSISNVVSQSLDSATTAITESPSVVAYASFDGMSLPPALLRGVYGYGFETPSVVQQKAIVPLSQSRDVIAMAQSGTGKTGAFSIGVLTRVDPSVKAVQALIMEPTRELAEQTRAVTSAFGMYLEVKVHLCVGGTRVSDDVQAMRSAQIVVGTPGRVCALLQSGALDPRALRIVVLDEADQMLSFGFEDAIRFVFQSIPLSTQVALFSATMPPASLDLTKKFMKDPERIMVHQDEISVRGIRQFYINVGHDDHKLDTMLDIFSDVSVAQCVIFCNTRRKAEWLAKMMDAKDFSVSLLHGDLEPAMRTQLMDAFRVGRTRVLITTDVLARGIDVHGVSCVVNFDLTPNLESYIHRIGRCGRYGRKGVAISIISDREVPILQDIQRFYSIEVPELPRDFANYL